MYILHVLGVLYICKFEWFTKTFRYSVILRYVVFTYKNLRMAIDCRLIANWLITIRSVQLTSYLYQNIQIVDMFLFLSLIVINDTERTLWIFCLFFNQNLILTLLHDNYSKRNFKYRANSHKILSLGVFRRQFDFSKQILPITSYRSLFQIIIHFYSYCSNMYAFPIE